MTLMEFLTARLAEEETVARTAAGTVDYSWQLWTVCRANVHGHEIGPRGSVEASPARVLAEVDARRRIVEHVSDEPADPWDPVQSVWRSVLAHLATVYASHPDYDERWRP